MKYYVAFDGGGTKLAAILFNENLEPVSSAVGSSMNTSSTPREMVRHNAKQCCHRLLEGTGVTEIECCYGVFPRIVTDELAKIVKLDSLDDRGGEGYLGMLAAGHADHVVLTLSGTGSVVFYVNGDNGAEAGGYGSVIYDEGSGYHMGRMAFAAAIKDFEQRGPKTLISEMICKRVGASDIGEAAYKMYDNKDRSPIANVASIATCVGEAARLGDEIAAGLLRDCGVNLAEQTLGLIRRFKVPGDAPIVLSGGHFKNDIRISRAFTEHIAKFDPRPVILPYFEPIVGAVLVHPVVRTGKLPSGDEMEKIKEMYRDYRYVIKE